LSDIGISTVGVGVCAKSSGVKAAHSDGAAHIGIDAILARTRAEAGGKLARDEVTGTGKYEGLV
jgi:hypothetical protein